MCNEKTSDFSLGCLNLIILLFVLAAILWGVSTPWGTIELDILPPAIRLI